MLTVNFVVGWMEQKDHAPTPIQAPPPPPEKK